MRLLILCEIKISIIIGWLLVRELYYKYLKLIRYLKRVFVNLGEMIEQLIVINTYLVENRVDGVGVLGWFGISVMKDDFMREEEQLLSFKK